MRRFDSSLSVAAVFVAAATVLGAVALAQKPAETTPSGAPLSSPIVDVDSIGDCMTMSRLAAAAVSESLPKEPGQLLALLNVCSGQINSLIDSGDFASIYIPTMISKDIALSLEERATSLPEARRPEALLAVRRLVLAAWQVDYYGDIGNRLKLAEAFQPFVKAVDRVKELYGDQ